MMKQVERRHCFKVLHPHLKDLNRKLSALNDLQILNLHFWFYETPFGSHYYASARSVMWKHQKYHYSWRLRDSIYLENRESKGKRTWICQQCKLTSNLAQCLINNQSKLLIILKNTIHIVTQNDYWSLIDLSLKYYYGWSLFIKFDPQIFELKIYSQGNE